MTFKTLSGYYQNGYAVAAAVTSLSITAGAYVGSAGGDPPSAGLSDPGDSGELIVANSGGTITGTVEGVYLDQPAYLSNSYGLIRYENRPAKTVGGDIKGGTDGVLLTDGGTVTNFDTIRGGGAGVVLRNPGVVINESTGTISGGSFAGVWTYTGGVSTVENFGVIESQADGVISGSLVVNEAGGLVTSSGAYGVKLQSSSGRLTNLGTIADTYINPTVNAWGVIATEDAVVDNGSPGDPDATIKGGVWFDNLSGDAALGRNEGLIEGYDQITMVMDYGSFINGAPGKSLGTIEGVNGAVALDGDATLINFGEIAGLQGSAAVIMSPTSRLDMEPGSTIVGYVATGGGTIDVAGGVCALASLGASGRIEGAGTLAIAGVANLFTGAVIVSDLEISGASTLVTVVSGTIADSGAWRQTAGDLDVKSLAQITFSGTGCELGGTISGAGTVDLAAGSDTLSNLTVSVDAFVVGRAAVTLAGAVKLETPVSLRTLTIAAGGATLSGPDILSLANAASAIVGASAAATLANDGTIEAAGQFGEGELTLMNGVGGVIDAAFGAALTLDTGTAAVNNEGLIECASKGGLVVDGAVANDGILAVNLGTLALDGAVTGVGFTRIGGGEAAFASTCDQNVLFTAGGVLELAKSRPDKVVIAGFSATGANALDLGDITFGAGTKATYSGTSAAGVLTVTDGTDTARITLDGDYLGSTFTLASDGHGGTLVTDPPARAAAPPLAPMLAPALATAIAGFATAAAPSVQARDAWREPWSALARPGAQA